MKSIQTKHSIAVVTIAAALASASCSNSMTSGGCGVSMTGPMSITHGMCATLTITYTMTTDSGTVPAPTPTDQSYAVTPMNGSVFQDTSCTTPLGSNATIHAGSSSVDIGFMPAQAGMSSGVMIESNANHLLTAGYSATAN